MGFFPSVGVVWQSGGLVDYYAGVRPDEAEPWRPAYEGEAALNVEAGVLAFYRFTDKVRGIALVRAQRLAGEYQDSPIIDDRWGYFGLVGASCDGITDERVLRRRRRRLLVLRPHAADVASWAHPSGSRWHVKWRSCLGCEVMRWPGTASRSRHTCSMTSIM